MDDSTAISAGPKANVRDQKILMSDHSDKLQFLEINKACEEKSEMFRPKEITEVFKPTLSELANVDIIDHGSNRVLKKDVSFKEEDVTSIENYKNNPSNLETAFSSFNSTQNGVTAIFEINKENVAPFTKPGLDVDLFGYEDDNNSNISSDLNQDNSDEDPNWYPEEDDANQLTRTSGSTTPGNFDDCLQKDVEDGIHDIECEGSDCSEKQVGSNTHETKLTSNKRKQGVRKRAEETKKKNLGLAYRNRKGVLCPAKVFRPITKCCTKNCNQNCTPEQQNIIWSSFNNKAPDMRKQVLRRGNQEKKFRSGLQKQERSFMPS
uniref:Uncharacterized protein LOC114334991 n=1 Tax=Diabrotica virgifera virgifera TaxID=50390 RepID=A0A6P7G7W9_DIAVI